MLCLQAKVQNSSCCNEFRYFILVPVDIGLHVLQFYCPNCQGIQLRITYTRLHQEHLKIDSLKNYPPKVSRCFYTLIIFNSKLKIITVP